MTDDEALETLFAMANVQDGYAKKATDPGLKVIHKANAKAQREIAATIKDLRVRLAAAEAERDAALARVEKLREALEKIDGKDSFIDASIRSGHSGRVVVRGDYGIIARAALDDDTPDA